MVKKDGRLSFDFTGTDPQSPGSINFFLNADMFRMFTGVSLFFSCRKDGWFADG